MTKGHISSGCFIMLGIIFVLVSLNYVSSEIIINEVMPNPPQPYDEWIEIYNSNNTLINVSEWKISVSPTINTTPTCTSIPNCSELTNSTYIIIIFRKANISAITNNPITYFNASQVTSAYWLTNSWQNITLYHFSNLVDFIGYPDFSDTSMKNYSYSKYNLTTWLNCTPTPGMPNNCSAHFSKNPPQNSTNNSTSNNTVPQTNTTQNTSQNTADEEYLELEWNKEDIINNQEFDVNVLGYNLLNEGYDVKVWIEDDGTIISEFYDDDEDKWTSGNYYFNSFFLNDGDEEREIRLRLKEKYQNLTGEYNIYARLRLNDKTLDDFSEDIEVLESEEITPLREDNETLTNSDIYFESPEIITLGALTGKSIQTEQTTSTNFEDSIIYKSKNEYIKEYAFYSFTGLSIMALAIVLIGLIFKLRTLNKE